ncbi:hypothetical protein ABIC09_002308 [Bradyrhizobium sp. S3.12.5]
MLYHQTDKRFFDFGIFAYCHCFARRVKWFLRECQGSARKSLIQQAWATVHGVVFDLSACPAGAPHGTFSSPSRYLGMTEDLSFRRKPLTPEQRQARDAARRVEAEKAMRDHEAAQKAFYENRERLKAERLAREAAAAKV